VFSEMVSIRVEEGYIGLKNYFVDGAKIEASVNKYSFAGSRSN
jgi:transposase